MVTSDGYGSWKILWQKVEGQYHEHMALSIFVTQGKEETVIQISNYQSLIRQSDMREYFNMSFSFSHHILHPWGKHNPKLEYATWQYHMAMFQVGCSSFELHTVTFKSYILVMLEHILNSQLHGYFKTKQTTQRGTIPAGIMMRADRSTAEKCPCLERVQWGIRMTAENRKLVLCNKE